MDNIGLRALLYCLANTRRQQWMIFAQETAYNQQTISLVHVSYCHTQPRNACLFAIGTKIGLTQTEVHIMAAQTAQQFLQ